MKRRLDVRERDRGRGGHVSLHGLVNAMWQDEDGNPKAGPSTWYRHANEVDASGSSISEHVRRRRRRRQTSIEPTRRSTLTNLSSSQPTTTSPPKSHWSTLTPLSSLLFLPFLAPALASPSPTRPYPPTRPTTPPDIPLEPRRVDGVHPTSVVVPTDLPTGTITVDETVLPYYLTRASDGSWEKVDTPWKLYGRQARSVGGVLADEPATTPQSFVVQSTLPKGWGQSSNRTSFYRVPLIVVASVILAIAIVVGIIVLVFHRRKAHRKAKRQQERLRRKALAAAGIDENWVNGTNAEEAFKEKLAELEQQHRATKRKDDAAGYSRVKVTKWTKRLRRRKGKGQVGRERPDIQIMEGEGNKTVEEENNVPGTRASSTTPTTVSSVMADSSEERPTGSTTSPEQESSGTTGTTDGSPNPQDDSPVAGPTYFPPAYRPASVRSYRADDSRPMPSGLVYRRSNSEQSPPPSGSSGVVEKTRAPGYYPAPATEEYETALAVVTRSEGKLRVFEVEIDEENQALVRHIATDDKRVLERMRLDASAPPASQPDMDQEQGPCAPNVDLDQDGFERSDQEEEVRSSLVDQVVSPHPDIPPPPHPTRHRSWREEHDDACHETMEQLDELSLLPSAPPADHSSTLLFSPVDPALPSAPPMEDDEGAGGSDSAPPAPEDEGGEEEREDQTERSEAHQHPIRPGLFLPRYEP